MYAGGEMVLSPEEWQAVAGGVLTTALVRRRLSFRDFAGLLAEHGLDIEPRTLARRVQRGTFDAGFFLMCLEVLGAHELVVKDGKAVPVLMEQKEWLARHGLVQAAVTPATRS